MPLLTDEQVGLAPQALSDDEVGLTSQLSDEDVGLPSQPSDSSRFNIKEGPYDQPHESGLDTTTDVIASMKGNPLAMTGIMATPLTAIGKGFAGIATPIIREGVRAYAAPVETEEYPKEKEFSRIKITPESISQESYDPFAENIQAGKPLIKLGTETGMNPEGNPIAHLIEGFTTPEMLASFPFGGTRTAQALFLAQTAPEAITAAGKVMTGETEQERRSAATDALINGIMSLGLHSHLQGKEPISPESTEILPNNSKVAAQPTPEPATASISKPLATIGDLTGSALDQFRPQGAKPSEWANPDYVPPEVEASTKQTGGGSLPLPDKMQEQLNAADIHVSPDMEQRILAKKIKSPLAFNRVFPKLELSLEEAQEVLNQVWKKSDNVPAKYLGKDAPDVSQSAGSGTADTRINQTPPAGEESNPASQAQGNGNGFLTKSNIEKLSDAQLRKGMVDLQARGSAELQKPNPDTDLLSKIGTQLQFHREALQKRNGGKHLYADATQTKESVQQTNEIDKEVATAQTEQPPTDTQSVSQNESVIKTPLKESVAQTVTESVETQPEIEGENQVPSTRGEDVMRAMVEKKLTEKLGDLPTHEPMNVKSEVAKAIKLIDAEPDRALRIATGAETHPNVRSEAVYTALEEKAMRDGSVATLQELANSNLPTAAGQNLKLLDSNDPHSPVKIMRDIRNARESVAESRLKTTKDKVVTEIKNTIRRTRSNRETWESVVNQLIC